MKKTIKIIDLLVKIANDEEVPKKIKAYYYNWTYDNEDKEYKNKYDLILFNGYLKNAITTSLNDEVEIIEEDKKIKKANLRYIVCESDFADKHIVDLLNKFFEENDNKINEIIDAINELEGKSE